MVEGRIILSAYKKAFQKYFHNRIVDLDEPLSNIQSFLIRIEDNIRSCGPFIRPNRQARGVILYFRKGSGEKTAGTSRFTIKDRTLMMIPSGTVHSGLYEGENVGYYLSFNLKFFLQSVFPKHLLASRLLFNRKEVSFKYLNEEDDKRMSNILETILEETYQHEKCKDEFIALKLLEFLILCDRFLHNPESAPKANESPVYLQYVKLIEKKYKEHHL